MSNKIESCVLAQSFYREHDELDIFEQCENESITINEDSVERYNEQLSWLGKNDVEHSYFDIIHLLEVENEYFVIVLSDSETDTIEQFNDLSDALECCKIYIETNFVEEDNNEF